MRLLKPTLAFLVMFPWAGVAAVVSCGRTGCHPTPQADAGSVSDAQAPSDAPVDAGPQSRARVENRTYSTVLVFASFGSDSVVGPQNWPFCTALDAGGCSLSLGPDAGRDLPTDGEYLNVTLSFNQPPGCQVSLGELNIGNPDWAEDTANISLVNGWNADLEIDIGDGWSDVGMTRLGPTQGPLHNAGAFGVYPNGCDICVAKQSPPCGIQPCGSPDGSPASCGCKVGSQYDPKVPCQWSFAHGLVATVALVGYGGVPAMKKKR